LSTATSIDGNAPFRHPPIFVLPAVNTCSSSVPPAPSRGAGYCVPHLSLPAHITCAHRRSPVRRWAVVRSWRAWALGRWRRWGMIMYGRTLIPAPSPRRFLRIFSTLRLHISSGRRQSKSCKTSIFSKRGLLVFGAFISAIRRPNPLASEPRTLIGVSDPFACQIPPADWQMKCCNAATPHHRPIKLAWCPRSPHTDGRTPIWNLISEAAVRVEASRRRRGIARGGCVVIASDAGLAASWIASGGRWRWRISGLVT